MNSDNRDLKTVDMACDFRATHDLGGFVAIFPDRHGGVSSAPFDSLNLGFSTGDKLEDVRENRQRLADSAKVSSEQIIVQDRCMPQRFSNHNYPMVAKDF